MDATQALIPIPKRYVSDSSKTLWTARLTAVNAVVLAVFADIFKQPSHFHSHSLTLFTKFKFARPPLTNTFYEIKVCKALTQRCRSEFTTILSGDQDSIMHTKMCPLG